MAEAESPPRVPPIEEASSSAVSSRDADLALAISLSYFSSLLLTLLSAIALFVNLFLLCSSHFLRRPIGVNLRLCVSLTASDALCAFFYILTYIINVLIPPNIVSNCWSLFIEVLKLATFFASVFTLLALALNHYVGIVYPLKRHAITHRTVRSAIAFAYLLPLAVFMFMFCFLPGGFRANEAFNFLSSHGCEEATILRSPPVRWVLVLPFILFVLLLSFLYIHIVVHMRRVGRDPLLASAGSSSTKQRATNRKLLVTLILLAGSACFGWLPTTVSYLVTCDTCLVPLPLRARLLLNVLSHALHILKLIVDAFIYSSRLIEIKYAIFVFEDTIRSHLRGLLGLKTERAPIPCEFTRYLTETKEHRSTRRKMNTRLDPVSLSLNGRAASIVSTHEAPATSKRATSVIVVSTPNATSPSHAIHKKLQPSLSLNRK